MLVAVVVLNIMGQEVIRVAQVLILYFLQLHLTAVVMQGNKALVVDQVALVVVVELIQHQVDLEQAIKVMVEALEQGVEIHYTAAEAAVVLEKVATLMELDMEEME